MTSGRGAGVFRAKTIACLACVLLASAWGAGAAAADPAEYLGGFGPDGTAATEFKAPGAIGVDEETGAVYLLDVEEQVLYKFDSSGAPLNYGGAAGYIAGNEITGLSLSNSAGGSQVAVDQGTHVVYVTSDDEVRAFEPDGEPHIFSAGPGEGTSKIPGAGELRGVAVDKYGAIYASDNGEAKKVRIYARSGALLTEFTPETDSLSVIEPTNLSVSPEGVLYVTNFITSVYRTEPSEFPVTPSTTFSRGTSLGAGATYSVAVDPTTSYVYLAQEYPPGVGSLPRVAAYDAKGGFLGTIGAPGQPGELGGGPVGIGVRGADERVFVAVRFGGVPQRVEMFSSYIIPVAAPTIAAESVTGVSSGSATVRARINPNTRETTYWAEYGLSDCSLEGASCSKVPVAGSSAGSGHELVPATVPVDGLSPGTKYYYRIVAENIEGTSLGQVRAFTTQLGSFGGGLSDQRAWELVTPAAKFGGVMTNANLLQADPDGSGIAFQTRGAIVEDPEGNRALETSSVLARRSGSSWSVSDLVPTHTEAGGFGFGPEFKLFSPDLGQALLEPRDDTPLSVESSERAPYLRTNTSPPGYRPLVTSKEPFANVPPGTEFGGEANGERNPVAISGANASLTHIVVSSKAALVAGAQERSIYLWHDGELEPVSELPAGGVVRAQPGSGTISVRNAVSGDGSRVFWAPGDPGSASLLWPALYLRDTIADETYRIDVPESGAGAGTPRPAFMAASADGSVVFFTDSRHLTEDASPEGRDLYRCEIGDVGGGALGCIELEDLSAPLEGSEENGEAEELALGMSEDGSAVYFVAAAVLDSDPNQAGESAAPGGPNLYRWQEGQGVRFVALLSPEDRSNWGTLATDPIGHGARVAASASPDGRYLTFMSQRKLTEDETADPESGEPVEQAYLYDAGEDRTICISCNPSGATDAGHPIAENESEGGVVFPDPQGLWSGRLVGATLPEASEGEPTVGFALYRPRAVLENGRAYFNSASPLVSADSNGTWDVYQYEPFGLGDCGPGVASGTVATTATGCISLLSSGTDSLPSVFMDASQSGDDVFFATFARLSALDTDTIVDVYDARVNGVEAVVERQTECAGEACQPSGSPPGATVPNSATFVGPGNVKPKPGKHCKKGQRKVKRKGKVRCVRQKKSMKHRHQRKGAKSKGRA